MLRFCLKFSSLAVKQFFSQASCYVCDLVSATSGCPFRSLDSHDLLRYLSLGLPQPILSKLLLALSCEVTFLV